MATVSRIPPVGAERLSIARVAGQQIVFWAAAGRHFRRARSIRRLRVRATTTRLSRLVDRSARVQAGRERNVLDAPFDSGATIVIGERAVVGRGEHPLLARTKLATVARPAFARLVSRTTRLPDLSPIAARLSSSTGGWSGKDGPGVGRRADAGVAIKAGGRRHATVMARSPVLETTSVPAGEVDAHRRFRSRPEESAPRRSRQDQARSAVAGRLRQALAREGVLGTGPRSSDLGAAQSPPRPAASPTQGLVRPARLGASALGSEPSYAPALGQDRRSAHQGSRGDGGEASDEALILTGEIVVDGRKLGALISHRQGRGLLAEPRGSRQVNARAVPVSSALNLPPP